MQLLERIISVIAPSVCIACDDEGSLFCEACRQSEVVRAASTCYVCGKIANNFETCPKCRRTSPLTNVWVVTKYDGLAKNLIGELKFDSRRDASGPIAELCLEILPLLEGFVVTHLPTSPLHIRRRGFDQARLIAKAIARGRYHYSPLLARIKNVHQIGASKATRRKQLDGAFRVRNKYLIKGSKVLLVDDVATTGASLEEAARTLKKAGAKQISAIVFART